MTDDAIETVITRPLVVLSGCSGGGKSSLLAALERRGHRVFQEPGRQVVRDQLAIGGPALPWASHERFAELCAAFAMAAFHQVAATDPPAFVDRSLIDAVASLPVPPAHLIRAVRRYRYAPRVFLVPPWPELFATDHERRHDFPAAVAEYERLSAAFPLHGYTISVVPKLPVDARAAWVLKELAVTGFCSSTCDRKSSR